LNLLRLLRVHAERTGWSAAEVARALVPARGDARRLVDFVAEAECCSVCAGALKSYNSDTRTVVTLGEGKFRAREVRKQCAQHPSRCPVEHSKALAWVVKAHRRYGYDVVVHAGLERYLGGKQREEIRAELLTERGIEVSVGTISALCDGFLSDFEALHFHRAS